MKQLITITTGLLLAGLPASSVWAAETVEVSSPDGKLTISFALKENRPALRRRSEGVLPRQLQGDGHSE